MMDFKDSAVKKILVPYDGSEQAQQAVKRAAHIARLQGATLMLLMVVDLNAEVAAFERVSMDGYVPAELKEGAYKEIAKIQREMPEDIHVNSTVELGSPAETIVETAEDEGYDLIVMGSRGLGRFEGFLMGSVSQYVLQHVHCPVLVVR
ncbi:universal stress protein [Selenomonas sputigena]|uniref:Universal stress protein n=1 Tax=Selenomonas sputigena TaxID=69823 RepID=A0ABV3X602_9FIRM